MTTQPTIVDTIDYFNTADQLVRIALFKYSPRRFVVTVTVNHKTGTHEFTTEQQANNYIARLQRGY